MIWLISSFSSGTGIDKVNWNEASFEVRGKVILYLVIPDRKYDRMP